MPKNNNWDCICPEYNRPATGAKPTRVFRLDDEEYAKVKEFIKKMRESNEGGEENNVRHT
jgi:hypothetical protein